MCACACVVIQYSLIGLASSSSVLHNSALFVCADALITKTATVSHYFITADQPDVFTVDEAVDKMGFGLFQILLCMFAGSIWVRTCD